jgi:hypothetical protein
MDTKSGEARLAHHLLYLSWFALSKSGSGARDREAHLPGGSD